MRTIFYLLAISPLAFAQPAGDIATTHERTQVERQLSVLSDAGGARLSPPQIGGGAPHVVLVQSAPGATPPAVDPRTRPPLSITQALSLAERELAARGLAATYIIKTITFSRAPRVADSFYLAMLDPIEAAGTAPSHSSAGNLGRTFKIDMRGTVAFWETPTNRVKVGP